MSEMKPTPGPWLTHREGFSTIYIQASIGGGWVQEIAACGPTNEGSEQQASNASLIAEAGTVFHETGLSPRQLVEMNAELVEALTNFVDGCSTSVNAHEVARAALTKASASSVSKGVE